MTSVTSDYFFGFDLLFKTVEKTISKKADVLIVLAHFMLVKNGFRCLGVGEDKTLSDSETPSELLPEGWNTGCDKFALRYMHSGQLFILLGHVTEGVLIVNLLNVSTKCVSNLGLDPHELVVRLNGGLAGMIPDALNVVERYRRELVAPVTSSATRDARTQTVSPASRPVRNEDTGPIGQFVSVGTQPRPHGFNPDQNIPHIPPHGMPGEIGRGDLDPLARGAGNLFPFPSAPDFRGVGPHMPGLPQPRFDPTNPGEVRTVQEPDPDHLPPPNHNHDFYM